MFICDFQLIFFCSFSSSCPIKFKCNMLKFHFFWECHVGISYKEMFLHLPCCSGTGELEVMVRIEALANGYVYWGSSNSEVFGFMLCMGHMVVWETSLCWKTWRSDNLRYGRKAVCRFPTCEAVDGFVTGGWEQALHPSEGRDVLPQWS